MSKEIEVSVVMPCLNEEKAVGICIKTIQAVFVREKISGEIIVVDNGSTDKSAEIARSLAIVVIEPRKGYGAAYLRGLKEAGGKYIIIADSDNTYDFNDIPLFLGKLKEGYDFVIGSRFKGKMEKGAMPWPNRYIGNPILSAMCRLFFGVGLSDTLCGMRAFTQGAYRKMRLRSMGMEFATEMIICAITCNLKLCELPINYHRRLGESKLRPFPDAWRYIRFMLLYCPVWLYFVPGTSGFLFGIFSVLFLLPGPVLFLGHLWDLHFMIFAAGLAIVFYQILNLGIFAHTYAISQRLIRVDRLTLFLQRHFGLEKGLFLGGIFLFSGSILMGFIFIDWYSQKFASLHRIRELILAITLLAIGLQTIFSSFLISLLFLKRR